LLDCAGVTFMGVTFMGATGVRLLIDTHLALEADGRDCSSSTRRPG
jgi:anti-anti-sigma regulatory factor